MKDKNLRIFSTAVITFLVTSAMYLGSFFLFPGVFEKAESIKQNLFSSSKMSGELAEIEKIIDENFIEDANLDKLSQMAAKGYVEALGDVYSEYYTKIEYESMSAELTGNYKGIGIQVVNMENRIVVDKVYKGSPAYESGIKEGDIIEKIDGKAYSGGELNEAVSAIRGTEKSAKISLDRNGEKLTVTVKKSDVVIPMTEGKMLDGNIGYINLMQFSEDADESFRTCLNTLVSQDAKALIIDLRGNPGGMLTTVVDIADLLLPEGNILTIKGRNTDKEEFMSGETFVDIPLYVLINGESASASEVLAGALKDHKRAVLIGETSYGKGLVQNIYELSSGGALKITTSKYYTPSGVCIDGTGIKPDYEIKMEPGKTYDVDPQLQKAIELINSAK